MANYLIDTASRACLPVPTHETVELVFYGIFGIAAKEDCPWEGYGARFTQLEKGELSAMGATHGIQMLPTIWFVAAANQIQDSSLTFVSTSEEFKAVSKIDEILDEQQAFSKFHWSARQSTFPGTMLAEAVQICGELNDLLPPKSLREILNAVRPLNEMANRLFKGMGGRLEITEWFDGSPMIVSSNRHMIDERPNLEVVLSLAFTVALDVPASPDVSSYTSPFDKEWAGAEVMGDTKNELPFFWCGLPDGDVTPKTTVGVAQPDQESTPAQSIQRILDVPGRAESSRDPGFRLLEVARCLNLALTALDIMRPEFAGSAFAASFRKQPIFRLVLTKQNHGEFAFLAASEEGRLVVAVKYEPAVEAIRGISNLHQHRVFNSAVDKSMVH